MFVIKIVLIKIVLNLLLIGKAFHCLEYYNHSDSGGSNKLNVYHKNVGKTNFAPIYIYSTALSDSKTLKNAYTNEQQYTKLNLTTKNTIKSIGKLKNNNNSVSNEENIDIGTLIQVLENDNHTIGSLLLEYIFDYGNTTGVSDHKNNNDANGSSNNEFNYFTVYDVSEQTEGRGKRHRHAQQRNTKHIKVKKKYKKFMLPLLLAYKLKFFALIPIIISGLVLLTGSTGLAGFFFALFAAVMGLKSKHK